MRSKVGCIGRSERADRIKGASTLNKNKTTYDRVTKRSRKAAKVKTILN